MSLRVKNTFIVVDEQSSHDIEEEEELSSGEIWCRRATGLAATGLRMTQSLPDLPRLGIGADSDNSGTTCADDTESKQTGYDTPDDLFDESQSEFGRSWSDIHAALVEAPPHRCAPSPEVAPNCSVADPCVRQGWMTSNSTLSQLHGPGDGLCAPAPAPREAEPTDPGGEVTWMMRNIPKKLTRRALLNEINSNGFAGTYDFVYLPMESNDSRVNRGYAFINLVGLAHAAAFKACYEGRQLDQYSSRKFISILPAVLQGFEANHAHFSTVREPHEAPGAQPLFLRDLRARPKSSEVPEKRRSVRAEGAIAKPAASTLKPRLQAESRSTTVSGAASVAKPVASTLKPRLQAETRTATNSGAASVPIGDSQTSPGKNESVINFCPYCGGSAGEGFKFCQYCGKSLRL